ncbi:TonB-dependent siderophore receptor, partial [Algiphilus sp.]|uniref:TonB-dependent siderophore receptor n=1 Tax=Algiphilus sp. TaxID=1872431 RepID=UPI003C35A5AC
MSARCRPALAAPVRIRAHAVSVAALLVLSWSATPASAGEGAGADEGATPGGQGTGNRAESTELAPILVEGRAGGDAGAYATPRITLGKGAETVRDIPQSTSIVTRQELDDRNITKLEDIAKDVTGLVVERFDGAGNFNVIRSRGFEIGAIQLDGIPIVQGGNYSTAIDTAIYDRIEVLRGPAGLLQGASEPGGTINLVRKRAAREQAFRADYQLGADDLQRLTADLTGPLLADGRLRGRVVAVQDQRESFVDVLDTDKTVGYGTLELDLLPQTTLSVGFARQEVESVTDQGLPTDQNGRLIDLPRSAFAGLRDNRQALEFRDAFVELEHSVGGDGLIKLAARDVYREMFYRAARSATPASPDGSISLQPVDFAQEGNDRYYDLFYTDAVWLLGREHRFTVGASHFEGDNTGGNFAVGSGIDFNLFEPDYGIPFPDLTLPGYQSITERDEDAIYGQAQVRVTERLRAIAGARLSRAEVRTRQLDDGTISARSEPSEQFIPNYGLIYDLNDTVSPYASYSETFVVQTERDAQGDLLRPRTGEQVELGVKAAMMDARLLAQAAVFRLTDNHRAVQDLNNPDVSVARGEVESQGFEVELRGAVTAHWDLIAGYAYTDTEFGRGPEDLQGTIFSPVTPRHLATLYTRYDLAGIGLPRWNLGGGASYRSEFFSAS